MSFLPGMYPGAVTGGVDAMEVSFIDSANSNVATITAPATIVAGDLLILFQSSTSSGSPPTAVTPSGWTNLVNDSLDYGVAGDRVMVDYKIAAGTEDGSTITGMDGSLDDRKVMLQFRGDPVIASVSLQDLAIEFANAGDPAGQTCNASGGVVPLIVFGLWSNAGGSIDPRSFSPAADGEVAVSGSTAFYVKYKIYNSSPANVSVDMEDEGNENILASFYLQISD